MFIFILDILWSLVFLFLNYNIFIYYYTNIFIFINVLVYTVLSLIIFFKPLNKLKEYFLNNELFNIFLNIFYTTSFLVTCIIIELILIYNDAIDIHIFVNYIKCTLFLLLLNVMHILMDIFFFYKDKLFEEEKINKKY